MFRRGAARERVPNTLWEGAVESLRPHRFPLRVLPLPFAALPFALPLPGALPDSLPEGVINSQPKIPFLGVVFDVDHDFEGPRAPKAHLDTVKYKPVTSPGTPP